MAIALACLAGCSGSSGSPPACDRIDPPASAADAGLPDDTVWGFVDLHTHPAIERAFGGRMIWGRAIDDAPVSAVELPVIDSCPVETHDPNASSPLDHAVGTLVFPHVAQVASFAHGPVGDLTYRRSDAWPNARDVIHQQMNIASIRRAYEGGLRLMFAATTHNQVIGALLGGPNFLNGFVPDPGADYDSARAQLELIQEMVERNSSWMGIARDPKTARKLIHDEGKLALVLSLEMDGLRPGDVERLSGDFGVQHVFPVHLIDNDVGGTAATSPLFNSATAAVSAIYRSDGQPQRFIEVAGTTGYSRSLGWPGELTALTPAPLYVNLGTIPYERYTPLCYEPLGYCAGAAAQHTSFIEVGQQNAKGLCSTLEACATQPHPGIARIRDFMHEKLMVDVSHMSDLSVADALSAVSPDPTAPDGYPLIASHGDISHLCDSESAPSGCVDTSPPDPGNERSLRADYARTLISRHGVLGLGSGTGTYRGRTVIEARGGPLLSLSPSGPRSGCVAKPNAQGAPTPGCRLVPDPEGAPMSGPVARLEVQTVGGLAIDYANPSPNSHAFLRVELDPPASNHFQHRIIMQPIDCTPEACSGAVDLGFEDQDIGTASPGTVTPAGGGPSFSIGACTALDCAKAGACGSVPYTVDHIDSVQIQWVDLACDLECQQRSNTVGQDQRCSGGGAPRWTVDQASVVAVSGGVATPLATIGTGGSDPVAVLDGSRSGLTLYARGDRPSANADVPATGHLLKITMTPSGATLQGATSLEAGANVCVALRKQVNGECVAAPVPGAAAIECPDGWSEMNHRGTWAGGTTLYTFARATVPEASICGVDVAVLDWDRSNPTWTVDEIKVEAIEDPVGHWIRRYAAISKYVAGGKLGSIGFGTDFNGLNGLTDISELPMPAGTLAPSVCPAVAGGGGAPDAGPRALAPMRLRHADGSLGGKVLIEERGLATYGLLADMVGIVAAYPGCGQDVYDSLMLSAEATIRAWEAIVDPSAPPRPALPSAGFNCGSVPGLGQ
jgi:microsomal dipeptidase-like Zn-dependent dipeptidase